MIPYLLRGVAIGVVVFLAWSLASAQHLPVVGSANGVFLLLGVVFVLRIAMLTRPTRLMARGRFEKALALHIRRGRRQRPGTVMWMFTRYNIANCLAWLGRHAESLDELGSLDVATLPSGIVPYWHYLRALNLLALERDPAAALAAARAANDAAASPQFLLMLANTADDAGFAGLADQTMQKYASDAAESKSLRLRGGVFLVQPAAQAKVTADCLVGRYELRRGRQKEAKAHLDAALAAPFPNCYTMLAKKLAPGPTSSSSYSTST